MPSDVAEFLQHMHAEKGKLKSIVPKKEASSAYDDEQIYYYNTDNEFSTILGQDSGTTWERRNKRMFNYIIDLPLGEYSSDWYLVTNDAIGKCVSTSQPSWTIIVIILFFFFQMIYWPTHRRLFTVKVQARAVCRFMPWSTCVTQAFSKTNYQKRMVSITNCKNYKSHLTSEILALFRLQICN